TFGSVEINGLDPDYMEGTASFSNLFLKTDNNQLSLDTVHLIALKNEKIRTIEIKSELAEAKLTGEYKLSTIFNELSSLYKDYLNIFRNDTTKIYSLAEVKKDTTSMPNVFDYQINFTDINSLFDVFVPDLKVSKNTSFVGNYQGGQTQIFNISTTSDTVTYKNNTFLNNNLEINSSKTFDNKVLAMIFVKSEEQNLAGIYSENLLSEAIWENDHIDFELNLDQESYKNHFNVLADIDFKNDSTLVTFQNSEIKLLDKLWELSEDGKIIFSGGDIYVDNFETKSPGQGFKLEGYLSSEEDKKFYIEFDSLQLENINSLINKELSGKLNGNVAISQFFGNTSIENELTITDLLINNFTVGDVEGSFLWNRMEKQFDVHFSVDYQKEITMELSGVYQPEKDENSLNIDAILVNAQLHILEPFIGSYFSKIAGTATGGFKITGTPLNPNIKGKGVLNDGEMTVNYLNTTYLLGGDFSFSEDMIFLDNINVKDKSGPGTGKLSGKIEHGGFREMKVNILGNFNKINVLNTSMKDNSLFYGQGIGTGDITFSGYTSNLSIVTNVKTEKGTRIYIPIEGTEYAETSDFISFVSFSDTLSTKLSEIEKIDIKGVLLEMNIEITPDAYCEIIFDIKAGDIIRGRGNGDLSLRIDTNGEFTMFGPLTISEGWYNFTLYNLINKEFSILPGGVISWYGDPYGGIMDLKANYNQTASLTPILEPVYNSAPELSRKYPTQVVMDLKGPLLSPEITFDINAIDLPRNVTLSGGDAAGTSLDLDFKFNSYKNKIDEQELKRQVFSLIVLRRFSPPEAFNTGGAITNSVSELFSNQLSYWMSQVDSNLEVDFDVDLTKLDEEAFNTFQLRLSYAFLDGRLRITRDGAFTDNQKQVNINSLAGNWSVEYLLTSDGKIKAKMYNKNNFDNVNLPDRNTTNTTGFSLQYTKSFDEFLKEMGRIFKSEKDRDKPPVKNDNTKTEGIE
ncbi:MAG: translocation/assembly module TamB, partial [Cyclobacteriaceae bacterium]|nr:translocation/assembly module TamB [Cyclobacteriaceae bacterium]